nr:autophagy-related protein 16-1-like isoform X3 [Hydra vulgaris]
MQQMNLFFYHLSLSPEIGKRSSSYSNLGMICLTSVPDRPTQSTEKLILASSNDNACWIWSINDLRLRHTLTGHSNKVMTAKFLGTDSSKIASGSYDRTIKVWDLRSKVCTKTIFAGSSCNDLVTSDIAGTTIISGHFDKKIRFWDIRCDQNSNEIQLQGKVASLDLSQDMNYLLACTRDDSLKLIDLRRNQIVSTYSPDAQYALCGSHDNNIYVWNTRTNQLDKVLKEHKSAVIATAWHPHGSSILSSDKNKHVILWNDF